MEHLCSPGDRMLMHDKKKRLNDQEFPLKGNRSSKGDASESQHLLFWKSCIS